MGLSTSILGDKAKISIGVENLLARYMYADIKYANMDLDIYSRWDGPVVTIQFSYKFGNQHFKSKELEQTDYSEPQRNKEHKSIEDLTTYSIRLIELQGFFRKTKDLIASSCNRGYLS